MPQSRPFRSLPNPVQGTFEPISPTFQASAPEDENKIKESFDILEQLGRGAFGTVFKAIHKADQSTCAIKVIPRYEPNGRRRKKLIMNEINIIKDLHHPTITPYLGEFHISHTSYIFLEYADGGNLEQLIRKHEIPKKYIKYWILDLAEALEYLRENKIIHRDVKTANILTTNDGRIQLTDFGLATRAPEGIGSGNCGTPFSRAPEVLEQLTYTYAVNWWSLGVVLYEMVTGKKPFKATKHELSERKILEKQPRMPSSVSPNFAELINKLLEKDPKLRLQSLNDFYDAELFKNVETP